MKKLLLLFAFAFCSLSFSQEYGWIDISANISQNNEFPPDLSDVFFVSDNEGWITSTSYSEIFRTIDRGLSFITQTTPLGATSAIQMLDADNGYSGGQGGWIYKTRDGGLNWYMLGSMGTLLDISFPFQTNPSDPIGYASGNSGNVWEITSTLTNLNSGSASTLDGISAPSVNNVWVCGGGRIYYYNGTNFTSQIAPTGTFNDIHFINNQEGWVVGNSGIIGYTTNGGALWLTQTNPDTQNRSLYGVFFLDSNNGWAVGNGGLILHTTNGGTAWSIEGEGLTTAFLRGVHFTSPTNGYVVGNDKTLLKFGIITSVENEEELPTEFSLSQNYPNPFNPSTKIKYSIPSASVISNPNKVSVEKSSEILKISPFGRNDNMNVTLKVYDVLGNEVATLVNEEKFAGSYEVEFNGNGLSSGIYFYQLKVYPANGGAGNFIQTKKMLLMK